MKTVNRKSRVRPATCDLRLDAPTASHKAQAFSLVELLVVITILVVLLALLAPAMDKAIYQAELAVCGAQQKAIASSSQGYAFDSRRSYPYRDGVRNTGVN